MDTQTELATVKNALEDQLGFLLSQGFQYSTHSRPTKRGDKDLYFFVYDQPERQYRFEIMYCTRELIALKGYFINYKTKEPSHLDFQDYLPFSRLTKLIDEDKKNTKTKISFDISDDIQWVIQVVQNTLSIIETQGWIDYGLLIQKEKKYGDYFEHFYQRGDSWITNILEVFKWSDGLTIAYNALEHPYHEGHGLVLSNTHGNTFYIEYGYRPSDTDEFAYREGGYIVEVHDQNGRLGFHHTSDYKTIVPFCKKGYRKT